MGRRKGSRNKPKDSSLQLKQPVSQKDIRFKMDILLDFGLPEAEIRSLFEAQDFISLKALDCFTNSVIRKALNDTSNAAM